MLPPSTISHVDLLRHDFMVVRNLLRSCLERNGAVIISGVDASSSEGIVATARRLGRTELDIPEALSGPLVMELRYDSAKAELAPRPAYFTADTFPLHTDLGYVANPPRFLLMQCVQPDDHGGGVSLLADCATAYESLDTPYRAILASRQFIFRCPPNCPSNGLGRVALYSEMAEHRYWRFRRDGMVFPEFAGTAVDAFSAALKSGMIRFRLEAGDLLIVDNHRMVHGRTAFDASRSRRHLRRVYARDPD